MTKPSVEGFCDSEFSELEAIFDKAIRSGFDDGAGFSLEVDGKEVLNLWGGYSDKDRKNVARRHSGKCLFCNKSNDFNVCLTIN